MTFRFVAGIHATALTITDMRAEATVGDLAHALQPDHRGTPTCELDGVAESATTLLVDWQVPCGATVRVVPPRAPDTSLADITIAVPNTPYRAFRARVVAGVDASGSVSLSNAPIAIGRSETADLVLADPTVSHAHCRISAHSTQPGVLVTDEGSTNGTWLGDTAITTGTRVESGTRLRVGASLIEITDDPYPRAVALAPLATDDPLRRPGTWRTSFNRPPRSPRPPTTPPLHPPDALPPPLSNMRLGIAGLLGPAVMGVVMVLVLHNLMWGVFALIGPLLVLGGWWDQRRNGRRAARGAARRHDAALDRFARALHVANTGETRRRTRGSPDLATVRAWAHGPSPRLWERRPDHDDFLRLRIGIGDVTWSPPLEGAGDTLDDRAAVIAAAATLCDVPIDVELSDAGMLGLVGSSSITHALARALIARACVLHGPADLEVIVCSTTPLDWGWCNWLPHLAMPVARDVPELVDSDRARLIVVTESALLTAHRAPARRLLQSNPTASVVVLAEHADRLPATCTTVVACRDAHGSATLHGARVTEPVVGLHLEGLSLATAESLGRNLARVGDPEHAGLARSAIGPVRLFDLVELVGVELAATLAQRWTAAAHDPRALWPLGIGPDGIVDVDLVADGPHLLVAGTTGSGKSELLRSMVVGLAASAGPDALSFLLIDFKGGSAFEALSRLPHTVGMVTDLTPAAATRTLRCLEAEVRRREHGLLVARAADLDELRARASDTPDQLSLARLVVVVDEFATLARELPDVLDALVSIAQRGRSLGIHLVLATQRPSGSVSDSIRANVGARIALRLLGTSDSHDVIDVPDAAAIPRRDPGRAFVRLGPDELREVQVASVSTTCAPRDRPTVACEPAWAPRTDDTTSGAAAADGPNDLDVFVEAARSAHDLRGRRAAPAVCPPPLERDHGLDEVTNEIGASGADPDTLAMAIVDLPDEQRRTATGWQLAAGPLLVVGVRGSGTTTALRSLALIAAEQPPSTTHLMVLDGADRRLSGLTSLPHTAAVVGVAESERQRRLVAVVAEELARRRRSPDAGAARLIVLVDDAQAFLARWADPVEGVLDQFAEVFTEGTAHGIHVAMATDRLGAIPVAWQSVCTQRWTFRVADVGEAPSGHPEVLDPARPAGRFLAGNLDATAHVARDRHDFDAAVAMRCAGHPRSHRSTLAVGTLPRHVTTEQVATAAGVFPSRLTIPVGVGYSTLAPTTWDLGIDEHALVVGPARSGRSSALVAIAVLLDRLATEQGAPLTVVTISGRRPSPHETWQRHLTEPSRLATCVSRYAPTSAHVVVLIDDADRLADDGAALAELLDAPPPRLHVIAAMEAGAARTSYGSVARAFRRSRIGLALCPDPDLDGEVFGVRLPRRVPVAMRPGLGYVISEGAVELAQAVSCVERLD